MSAKRTFVAASDAGDVVRQVQIASAAARRMIVGEGLDLDLHNLRTLAGVEFPTKLDAEHNWAAYCHHINAAFALGIAIGQLVHPDLFKPGGAR